MKKYFILLLVFISTGLSGQENSQYIQLYNSVGTNIYSTGMYSIPMYDINNVSDIYIENFNNTQVVGIVIISTHKYSSLALFELMCPFIGSQNSYYDDGDGVFITNRGLIIVDMRWGALIISKSVLLSDETIRDYVYSSLLNQFCNITRTKDNKVEIFNKTLELITQYSRYKMCDQLLVQKVKKSIENEINQ